MNQEPREFAATESYPTFWDEVPKLPVAAPTAPDEAYSTFVNLAEDEFPSGEYRIDAKPDAN